VGFPSLRLRGDYLAVVTLGFGEAIRTGLNALPFLGGPRGLLGIPRHAGFTAIYVAACLTVGGLARLQRSSHGRAMRSIREDETAAAMAGVDVVRHKVLGFALGAALAGLAGGLQAHLLQMAHPTQFGFLPSAMLLVTIYAGGVGSLTGSALAALLFTFLTEGLRLAMERLQDASGQPVGPEWTMALYALILVLIIRFRPGGLMGTREAGLLGGGEET
jgi:branched-chain amino acid transport system permease protein